MLPLLFALARADVPPPPGYVETCTVAIQCGPDIAGESCDAWHGGREPCEALEKKGWVQVCQTRGASVWDEVFCETQPDEDARQERVRSAKGIPARLKRRCGCASAPGAAGALLLPLVALFRRRGRPQAG